MKNLLGSKIYNGIYILFIGSLLSFNFLFAQQTKITDYVIFGGKLASGQTTPVSPGYGVQIGSSCNIQGGTIGGTIGSYNLVKSTGSIILGTTAMPSNIFSGGAIQLANSNVVTGRLSAASSTGTVISVGSSANIAGNIDANGSIKISGGKVSGTVTHPAGTTYSGPVPAGGNVVGTPNLPTLPTMPAITVFPAAGTTNIASTQTITPGSYGNITMAGNQTLTLSGTGIYVFKSINITNSNKFVFDFKSDLTGTIKIYVFGDADLHAASASIINGGDESRIYLETHGTGSTSPNGTESFDVDNPSSGQVANWVGSVWAPYAAINIGGVGSGTSKYTGALWSGTQVIIQNGVSIVFKPFNFCTTPVIANKTAIICSGSAFTVSPTNGTDIVPAGTTYSWSSPVVTGGMTDGKSGNGASSITATLTNPTNTVQTATYSVIPLSGSCTGSSFTITVTVNPTPSISNKTTIICSGSAFNVSPTNGTDIVPAGITYIWTTPVTNPVGAITGGSQQTTGVSSISQILTNTTNAAATLTYTVTPTSGTCVGAIFTVTATVNSLATANAGSNQTVCSNNPAVTLNGSVGGGATGGTWSGGTGTFIPNVNTLNAVYNLTQADSAAGSVTLALTSTGQLASCSAATSTMTIIINPAPTVNAGPDKALDINSQAQLTGTTTFANPSFSWQALNGGVISSATNQATITVSAAGTYVLTVTVPTGCSATDTAIVTSKVNSVIGSELQSISDTYNPNVPTPPSPIFLITPDGYVMIDVIVFAGFYDSVLNLLQTAPYGLKNIIPNGSSSFIITGQFPIVNLPKLDSLGTIINYVRPYYQGVINNGLVSSAGDTTMRSNLVRSGYNINGAGIKVGVISNSFATIPNGTTVTLPLQPSIISPYTTNPLGTFNPTPQTFNTSTAAQDITNDDLPGPGNPKGFTTPVTVLQDFPIQESDEGRAMLQIIHDVAPGAGLYFRTGFFSPGDFALGIKQLKNAGCNVIVDDITFITEPFLQDGIVAKTVDTVTSQGVTYFSAAGNFANRSYESNFNPVPADDIGFIGKKAHDFSGTGDRFQHVRLAPGSYTFVFQWVDSIYSIAQAGGTQNDLDIYLTPNTDGTALIGYNRNNTNGDPIEFIPITISGTDSVDYNILIINNTTTSNPSRVKYVVFSGGIRIMEYNVGTSTIVGQANADSAIAVGAARYNYIPGYINTPLSGYPIVVPNNPANPLTNLIKPQIESFSSIGGTQINGKTRNKPDIVAPDGVKTTVKMGQDYPDWALTGYSNFFGTSAAAPHTAAVAALIMQGRNKFLGQPTSSAQIRSLLQTTATNMSPSGLSGYDYTSGFGLINADSAMRTFAAPTPELDSLIVPKTTPFTIPGDTVFTVTVKGQNFSYNSQIYFNDSALASTTVINKNAATAIIPKFDSNPSIRVYTPPITKNSDGGFSNSLYFFQANIVVSADSITKKYGELLVPLDTTITINGVLLKDTSLSLTDMGLSKLTLTTAATTSSDVGTYIITPSGNFDLSNPIDSAFLVKYHYKFNNAAITINKMPLTVTPNNQTINYGQYIGNPTFTYNYDSTNVPNPASLDSLIRAYHQAYLPNNALAVVNGFSNKQSDGSVLTTASLSNMNMIASFNAVNNSRKFQLDNNNNLIPISNPNAFNIQYLVDVTSASIFNNKINPTKANFYRVYPGIDSKALLSASSLSNNTGQVYANGSLVHMVNGSLVPMINSANGSLVPIVNGSLVQILNGSLVQIINGVPTPLANSSLVQLVNGSLVQLVNGVYTPIADGSLVQLVNGTLVQMVNGSLVQMVNGSLVQLVNGQYVPISNSSLVQLVNGSLVQYVNGVYSPVPNGSLVQLVNGSLIQMVNGSLVQLVNGSLVPLINGSLVPIINGSLVQLVNGSLVQLVNGTLVPIINGSLVQLVNGSLVQMVNGSLVQLVNSSLVQLINGSLVQMVNGSLVQMVNSNSIGANAANNNTAVIIDTADVNSQNNNWLGPMFGINMITGLNPGQQSLIPGVLVNSNFDITYGLGIVTIKPDTIIVTAKDTSREYGSPNPAFAVTYSGFAPGDSLQNSVTGSPSFSTAATQGSAVGTYSIVPGTGTLASPNYFIKFVNGALTIIKDTLTVSADSITRPFGIPNPPLTASYKGFALSDNVQNSVTGTPSLTTTAVETSPVGTYPITISDSTLASSNYYIRLVNGVFTVTSNSCLISHSPFTSFASTAKAGNATSLWVSIVTTINGQLTSNGDFILFKGGNITLNNITSTPLVNNLPIPDGKIVADNTVATPVTSFNAATNTWITRVPLGYTNNNSIFITGAIVNSSTGFVSKSNANSVIQGILYSDKTAPDADNDGDTGDWAYAIAAYQPQFSYSQIAAAGQIASISGTYSVGTPIPIISNVVSGGSGNGKKNYTGNESPIDNYTACQLPANSPIASRANNNSSIQQNVTTDNANNAVLGEVLIIPNPATTYITLSFVPVNTGSSKIVMYSIDGKKVLENYNGVCEAGINYQKRIDVSKFITGLYLVQLWNGDKVTSKKIIIIR